MSESSKVDVYAEVRKRGSSNSKIEKENFETLQAIEESIQSKTKGDLSPVKYFNALMTMLNTNTGYYRSLLYLLQLILPQVSESTKQNKCMDCMEVLLQVPKCHKKTFEPSANRSLIVCISQILQSQKPSEELWNEKFVKKGVTYLLNQCIHTSPKIRHVAEDELVLLMELQQKNHLSALSKQILSFLTLLTKKLDDASSKNITNFLSLIAKVILVLDRSQYDLLLSLLLQIRSHKINYLEFKSLRPLEIILSSDAPITLSYVKEFLNTMLTTPVATEATAVDIMEYIKTICFASKRLVEGSDNSDLLSQTLTASIQYFQSANTELLPLLTSFLADFFTSLPLSILTEEIVQNVTISYQTLQKGLPKESYSSFLPALTSFLRLIGESFPAHAQTLIQSLLSLYDSCSGKNTIYRPLVVDALKTAILSVPLPTFLQAVSLTKENGLPNETHYFLYHLLEETLCHKPCSLAFFFDHFSPIVKACQKEIVAVKNTTQKRRYQINIADIFNIFASCCSCATDAAVVLPSYKKMLVRVLNDEHNYDAGVAVCKALAILIRSNQQRIETREEAIHKDAEEEELLKGENEDDKEDDEVEELDAPFMEKLTTSRAPKIDATQAEETLKTLSHCMEGLIEAGFTLYDRCHGTYTNEIPKFNGVGQGGEMAVVLSLRYALTVMCSIVSKQIVSSYTTRILTQIQNLDNHTEIESVRQHIVAIGQLATLIPSLPHEQPTSIMTVLSFVKEHMEESSIPVLQRRYYYCLLLLCHYHGAIIQQEGELMDLMAFMLENLQTVSYLVRKYRMKSLFYLIPHLSGDTTESLMNIIAIIPKFVLCIKDSNKVIRSICFDIIIALSMIIKQAKGKITLPDGSSVQSSLVEYFKIMMGCLTSDTAHMKSASLMCISCVLYHYRDDPSIWPTITDLIHIVYSFLEEKSRELVKACFGFIRTCVKAMPEELLKEELHDIIVALLPWARDSRNHFKSRVRAIVELLVRRLGKTTILEQLPEEEKGLLDQILNTEPVKTDEQLVKEMEEEMEKIEPNEEDDEEVIEIDEAGNIVGETDSKGNDDFAALLQEIANSEDLKRAVRRREMWENELVPSKKQHVEENEEEIVGEGEKLEKVMKREIVKEKKKKGKGENEEIEKEKKEIEIVKEKKEKRKPKKTLKKEKQ